MNQWQVISLIALLAWLFLAVRNFSSAGASRKRTVTLALVWAGLFGVIALLFSAYGG